MNRLANARHARGIGVYCECHSRPWRDRNATLAPEDRGVGIRCSDFVRTSCGECHRESVHAVIDGGKCIVPWQYSSVVIACKMNRATIARGYIAVRVYGGNN